MICLLAFDVLLAVRVYVTEYTYTLANIKHEKLVLG